MTSADQDPLQSLIAEILDAENRGESVDRDALLSKRPEHAESLRDFFAQHDRMKSAVEAEDPTLPPNGNGLDDRTIPPEQGSQEEATIPPKSAGDDPTIPPTEPASAKDLTVGDHVCYFGDYELLEEIARGGMGVVYKARQMNLNRIVALKMILAGQFAGDEDVQRFYTEAEAAAQLDHPGIVPIIEIGEHEKQHYFSMGYVEGESLAHKVIDGPLPPREAAETIKKVCDAMAYAHERGVIHRDLKPANILIDQNGQPKVTDFGLAKKTEADSNLTSTGQILGTPAYMPPEQASGKTDVGPLADVYSIGAILYCLLTGRPPFQAASPMDTLLQVLDREPVAPRVLNKAVPKDLETICLKCLDKRPSKRYVSASGIAQDLQRYVNGEPVLARPTGPIERTWRWCKRNPGLSISSMVAGVLLLSVAIGGPLAAIEQSRLKNVARENESEALQQRILAERKAEEATNQRNLAVRKTAEADLERRNAEWQLYRSRINLAQREAERGYVNVGLDHLRACDPELAGWEHKYLVANLGRGMIKLMGHTDIVSSVAISPDGQTVASGSRDRTIRLWDIGDGKTRQVLKGHEGEVTSITFSPDGRWIASGSKDGTVILWNAVNGQPERTYSHFRDQNGLKSAATKDEARAQNQSASQKGREASLDDVLSVAFSPDSKRIAFTSVSSTVEIRDLETGDAKSIRTSPSHQRRATWCEFHPDGSKIATGAAGGDLKIWDLDSGGEVSSLHKHTMYVSGIDFNENGSRLVSGSMGSVVNTEIVLWDTVTAQAIHTFSIRDYFESQFGRGSSYSVAFSHDEKWIAAGSISINTVKVWDAISGREQVTLRGHTDGVSCVAFHPNSSLLVSGSWDRNLIIWNLREESFASTIDYDGGYYQVALSPDGRKLAAETADHNIMVWDPRTLEELLILEGDSDPIGCLAFSPDSETLVSASRGYNSEPLMSEVRFWNTTSGEQIMERNNTHGAVRCLAISPDGTRFVTGTTHSALGQYGGEGVTIWDFHAGRVLGTLTGHTWNVDHVAFTLDGTQILSASRDNIWVRKADVNGQQKIRKLRQLGGDVVTISEDGTRAIVATKHGDSYGCTIWDTFAEEKLVSLKGHRGVVQCAVPALTSLVSSPVPRISPSDYGMLGPGTKCSCWVSIKRQSNPYCSAQTAK